VANPISSDSSSSIVGARIFRCVFLSQQWPPLILFHWEHPDCAPARRRPKLRPVLNREITTFRCVLPSLTREEGKFALIVGDILIGVFDTYEDALKTGQQKAQSRSFLVKKISAAENI
jgi:hypothetical protein